MGDTMGLSDISGNAFVSVGKTVPSLGFTKGTDGIVVVGFAKVGVNDGSSEGKSSMGCEVIASAVGTVVGSNVGCFSVGAADISAGVDDGSLDGKFVGVAGSTDGLLEGKSVGILLDGANDG